MEIIKTGFWQVDEALDGLKRGEVYFISALERNAARGFAASLCASVESLGVHRPLFITDSPIPYCRCEHIHFASMDELIEFFRVILDGDKTYELPKIDLYVFEDIDLLSMGAFNHWPQSTSLQAHLYEVYLYTIKNLAEAFQVSVLLIDQWSEDNHDSNGLNCDFPDIRYKLSCGSFKLNKVEANSLLIQYIGHRNLNSFSFHFTSAPKEITQVFPFLPMRNKGLPQNVCSNMEICGTMK